MLALVKDQMTRKLRLASWTPALLSEMNQNSSYVMISKEDTQKIPLNADTLSNFGETVDPVP